MDEREGMIPIREVRTAYSVDRRTVERWVKRGVLTTYRFPLDRVTYVRRSELEAALEKEPAPRGNPGGWRIPEAVREEGV